MELRRADGGVIAVEVVGEPDAPAVPFCHGLADSRLAAYGFAGAAHALGLRLIAPDRPGIGGTDARRLPRVVDWAAEATLVLDALDVGSLALLGVSGGGAFAAACASELPDRVRSLLLIAPLGPPAWPTRGMAAGQRAVLQIARHAPAFGGWFLGRLATLARQAPGLFLRLATSEMPASDRRALAQSDARAAFLTNYLRTRTSPQDLTDPYCEPVHGGHVPVTAQGGSCIADHVSVRSVSPQRTKCSLKTHQVFTHD
ncbi:alpha/beta fold hydrolase [Streptomyces sp. NBC_00841]|uniref:alpha/beta fold hydrolase n=1 Tax=Streptomyces sp. NBC_00841 TaxID=2975847 RepID=UPI002DD7E424|nr:alpha/beta fold hydrolase [Streptomyces sp. NBC_00841]WRZ97333.1 alpha/beta fold hydrolase [Streptomyces sp. NBC_00841]